MAQRAHDRWSIIAFHFMSLHSCIPVNMSFCVYKSELENQTPTNIYPGGTLFAFWLFSFSCVVACIIVGIMGYHV